MNVNDLINKRFLELAVKAKLPGYVLEPGTELCLAPHLQQFAELIVRDVCNKLEPVLAKEILELYGVEDAPVNDVDRILQTVRTQGQ
jgi:hypothetical protein